MRNALVALAIVSAACSGPEPARSAPVLMTTAERTQYASTGRYAEVEQLCRDFAAAYTGVTCDVLGRTGMDRPIVAVRVEKRPNLPVIYIQGGIHAGEIEGKDAGFAALRDLLDGKLAPGALDAVAIVF